MDTVVVTDASTGKVIIFNTNLDDLSLDHLSIEDKIYSELKEKYGIVNTGSVDFFIAKEIKMEIDLC